MKLTARVMRETIPSRHEAEHPARPSVMNPIKAGQKICQDGCHAANEMALPEGGGAKAEPCVGVGDLREVQRELSDANERQSLEQKLTESSERERRTLAHDLHDGVCQQLSGVALMTATLRDQCERKAKGELALKLTEIGDLIRNAFDQVREVARKLNPVDVDANGLAAALGDLARRHDLSGTIKCRFLCNQPVPIHDNGVAIHLYRIAQEALGNAIERRNARQILISLGIHDQQVLLSITDDGSGIPGNHEHLPWPDLKLMRYRAKCVGADLTMENSAAGGTVVRCSLPRTR